MLTKPRQAADRSNYSRAGPLAALRRLHSITSSCFGVGMTRLINEQNIRTPQRIENRACNDPRILATDMKPISCGLPSMRVMCLEYSIRN
jgi:hypothetical protein